MTEDGERQETEEALKAEVFSRFRTVWVLHVFLSFIPILNGIFWLKLYAPAKRWRDKVKEEYGVQILPNLWVLQATGILHLVSLLLGLYIYPLYVAGVYVSVYMLLHAGYRVTGEIRLLRKLRMIKRLWLWMVAFGMLWLVLFIIAVVKDPFGRPDQFAEWFFSIFLLVLFAGYLWMVALVFRLAGECRSAQTDDPAEIDAIFSAEDSGRAVPLSQV